MVLFNYATREITAKIVYYGPGLCGKTTNLQFIYDSLPSNNRSKMLSLATKTDRTLFFDFLPLDLGKIRGMRTKLQLYTVPGQVYYNSTRQLVLKGADGIVFVADSQDFAVDANLDSLQNLEDNLKRQGMRIREVPLVLQYNKRDLPNALSVADLETAINKYAAPHFQSVATTGIGVEETLKGVTRLVLNHLVQKYGLEGSESIEDLRILDAPTDSPKGESVWEDVEEEALAASVLGGGNMSVIVDDVVDPAAPMAATELIRASPQAPITLHAAPLPESQLFFEDEAPLGDPWQDDYEATEVPLGSIEIPMPRGLLESLPDFDTPAMERESERLGAAEPLAPRHPSEGLVREITVPLRLTAEEIRDHRKLNLRINLEIEIED
jgi:signal recognition particle receptor subunit beta